MLLAIDVGNTNVTLGLFEGTRLVSTWRVSTALHRMPDEYAIIVRNLLRQQGLDFSNITKVALCSVVPPLTAGFEELSERYIKTSPLVVGAGVKTGVRIRLDNPREAGPDRIVDVVAAHQLYGGPIIIVDMGTATTFDVVSKEGDFMGGAIAPGIRVSADALVTRTSMLPRVELLRPERAIGTSTITAMQSGIIFGYVGLVEGIIHRIQKELAEKAKVIATGGYAGTIARETKAIDVLDPDLTLVGLRIIYFMNRA